jgi:hypothetical protein
MAKLKAKLLNALQNPLAEHSRDHASVSAISTAFYTHGANIIMRTKPKSPPHTSEAQLYQQELWKDGDCMWRGMTYGQRVLWNNYYVGEYRAGRTSITARTSRTKAGQQIPHKDMGTHALFMSHALRLDLLVYLTEFLLSEWLLSAMTDKGDHWQIDLALTNPPELTEASIFQERLPIRGR